MFKILNKGHEFPHMLIKKSMLDEPGYVGWFVESDNSQVLVCKALGFSECMKLAKDYFDNFGNEDLVLSDTEIYEEMNNILGGGVSLEEGYKEISIYPPRGQIMSNIDIISSGSDSNIEGLKEDIHLLKIDFDSHVLMTAGKIMEGAAAYDLSIKHKEQIEKLEIKLLDTTTLVNNFIGHLMKLEKKIIGKEDD